jgi:hypothetical protein
MQIASSQPVEPGTDMRRSRFALIRNTSGELKTTTMKTWQECWPPEKTGPLRESSPMTHVISRPARNGQPGIEAEFMFIPLDKPKDVRHLRSLDLTAAWCNEASELPPAIIQMLRTRVGRFPRRQGEQAFQFVEEAALVGGQPTVGLADAQGHFIGELALPRVSEHPRDGSQRQTLEDHVLIESRQVGDARFIRQILGNAAHFLTLALVLGAIGESGMNGNGENGFLFLRGHGCLLLKSRLVDLWDRDARGWD